MQRHIEIDFLGVLSPIFLVSVPSLNTTRYLPSSDTWYNPYVLNEINIQVCHMQCLVYHGIMMKNVAESYKLNEHKLDNACGYTIGS